MAHEARTGASTGRPLKVGIGLPDVDGSMGGATARWADLIEITQLVEQAGFDSVWYADHLLFRFPGEETAGIWEGFSIIAGLAAITTRVELGPLVACTSFRNPALLAKMADTIDEISGGRFILGLGAGWHEPEYQAFGYPFDHRYSRFEEALTIIHGLLKTGHVDVEGTYYIARECELRPRGPRGNTIPIMLGTPGEKMMRLTARYADIWNIFYTRTNNSVEGFIAQRDRMLAVCDEVDRDPATLQITTGILVDLGGTIASNAINVTGVPLLRGTPEELAEELHAYARAGAAHVQVYALPQTLRAVETFASVLEQLDKG